MVSIRAKRLRAAEVPPIERVEVEAPSPREEIGEIQDELKKLDAEAKAKILETKKKCIEMEKPIYGRRNEIIREIPDFWLSVLLKHPKLRTLVTEEDKEIFGYLDSLHVENFEDYWKGYCITLNFKANPYFRNTQLRKTIKFLGGGAIQSRGTTIHWMAGKGPVAVGFVDENGNRRPFPSKSFFSWFCFPGGYEGELDQDWVADTIKEEIWPNPMKCLDNVDEDGDDYEEKEHDDEGDL